jgi:hypothetical protein
MREETERLVKEARSAKPSPLSRARRVSRASAQSAARPIYRFGATVLPSPMPRIVATAHRMMPAHEVDAMAAIARQTSTGSACVGNVAGTAGLAATRAAGACCTGAEGDGRRWRLTRTVRTDFGKSANSCATGSGRLESAFRVASPNPSHVAQLQRSKEYDGTILAIASPAMRFSTKL